MSCRNNKPKCNCGTKQFASCVYYKGYLPKYSKLEQDCTTLEETTEEIYRNQEEILDSIDLSKLGKSCIDYSDYKEGDKLKVKEALLAIESKFCEKNSTENDSCCIDMTTIDLKCLTDPCNNLITTQQQLIQALINKVCLLEQRINTL
jgi:hypothetical protein